MDFHDIELAIEEYLYRQPSIDEVHDASSRIQDTLDRQVDWRLKVLQEKGETK